MAKTFDLTTDLGDDYDNGDALHNVLNGTTQIGGISLKVRDTILLGASVTYESDTPFELPYLTPISGDSADNTYLKTNAAFLPANGVMLNPAIHSTLLPTLLVHSNDCIVKTTQTSNSARRWVYRGLELLADPSGLEGKYTNVGIQINAVGSAPETYTAESTGHRIQHCWVHDITTAFNDIDMKEVSYLTSGMVIIGSDIEITDSYIQGNGPTVNGATSSGFAIIPQTCDGILIENTRLESAFNVLFFGGGDSAPLSTHTATVSAHTFTNGKTSFTLTLSNVTDIDTDTVIVVRQALTTDYSINQRRILRSPACAQVTGIAGNVVTCTPLAGSTPPTAEVTGKINNSGGYSSGATTIALDNIVYNGVHTLFNVVFDGSVGASHRMEISGHTSKYSITNNVTFTGNAGTITISPALEANIADNLDIQIWATQGGASYQDFWLPPLLIGDTAESYVAWGASDQNLNPNQKNITVRNCQIRGYPDSLQHLEAEGKILKGYMEIKCVNGLTLEGNHFYSSIRGTLGVVCVNQSGYQPWVETSNIIIRNNWIENLSSFTCQFVYAYNVQIASPAINPQFSHDYLCENNVIEGANSADDIQAGGGRAINFEGGGFNITVKHNCFFSYGNICILLISPLPENLIIRDNIFTDTYHGMQGDGGRMGTASPDTWVTSGARLDTNIIYVEVLHSDAGFAYVAATYPAATDPYDNYIVSEVTAVKYHNLGNRDYRLDSDSPGHGTSTDSGQDIGPNYTTLFAAMTNTWPVSWTPSSVEASGSFDFSF